VTTTIEVASTAPEQVALGAVRARRGEVVRTRLDVDGLDPAHRPYVTLIGGRDAGPVVTVVAGVHGAEVSSIEAARRLAADLGGHLRRGTVAVVPVANLASFFARSLYVNPVDGKNLNRVFPGRPDGTASERLAHALVEQLVRPADVVLDLHGGDIVEALDPFMMAEAPPGRGENAPALELAAAFALDQVLTGHVAGSLAAAATQLGRAALLAECGQQGVVSPLAVERLAQGVLRILDRLDMLDADARPAPPPGRPVYRPGWTWMNAEHTGYWLPAPAIAVGREVTEGALLGVVQPLDLDLPPVEVRSPHDGRILFLVTALSAVAGAPLCAVARPAAPWPLEV
jgi:predicted deacylase